MGSWTRVPCSTTCLTSFLASATVSRTSDNRTWSSLLSHVERPLSVSSRELTQLRKREVSTIFTATKSSSSAKRYPLPEAGFVFCLSRWSDQVFFFFLRLLSVFVVHGICTRNRGHVNHTTCSHPILVTIR